MVKFIKLAVAAVLLIAIAYQFWIHRSSFDLVLSLSLQEMTSVFLFLHVFYLISFAGFWLFIMIISGVKLGFKEWLNISLITNFANLVIPWRGGTLFKHLYMKNKYNVSYADTTLAIICQFLISVSGLTLFATSWYSGLLIYSRGSYYMAGLAVLLMISFIVLYIKRSKIAKILIELPFGETVVNASGRLSGKKVLIALSMILSLLSVVIGVGYLKILFGSLGGPISWNGAVGVMLISTITNIASLTPGNWGVQEFIIGYSPGIYGISLKYSIAAAALNRIVQLVISAFWMVFFYLFFGARKIIKHSWK